MNAGSNAADVSPLDGRFLVTKLSEMAPPADAVINVVLNGSTELTRAVPAR